MTCKDLGHGFLVRMSQNRVALDPGDGRRLGTVFEQAAAAEPAGGFYLDWPLVQGWRRDGRGC